MKKSFLIVFTAALMAVFFSCSSKEYKIGDIVMTNGSVLSVEEYKSYSGNEKPVAVIFSTTGAYLEQNSSRVLGVGLYGAKEPLRFAKPDSDGDNTNMLHNRADVISQDYDVVSGVYQNQGFVGDLDGFDSWKDVLEHDTDAANGMSEIYPAYNFAINYGSTNKCKKFDNKKWYLPSIAELYELYTVLPVVNESIEACGGDKIKNAVWSSSQTLYRKNVEFHVNMSNGEVTEAFKDAQANVRSVYRFAK